MNTKSKPNKQPHKSPQPDFRRSMIIWIVILLLMLLFYVPRFLYSPKTIEISYSEFKHQVETGNVSEITIKGEEIRGTFENEYMASGESKKESYSSFVTVMPSFADPELIHILEENNVTIKAKKQGSSWLSSLLIFLLPWLLIIGFFVYTQRRMSGMMGGPGGIFGIGRSRAKRYEKTSSDVTYNDVAGLENAKKDMQEIVEYLKEPDKFAELGAEIPKGILLVGPPGTGKTLLARATAGEADVPFFSISGSEFIEMFVGVSASRVRDMFTTAKNEAPSIIFIDEIDSIGRARGTGLGGGHDEREQTLNQILSEMDGFAPHESVIVLAATNRPDVLDSALTRPERFDRQITLDLPQKQARQKNQEKEATMDQLDQLEALIEAELQLYGERQDATLMDEMSVPEIEQYKINKENRRENLTRIYLLQEIRSWIGHIREEMRLNNNVSPDSDPLSLLEKRILENLSETDLITSEILQKVNIWISEIRDRNL